jgi:hypothetical protein
MILFMRFLAGLRLVCFGCLGALSSQSAHHCSLRCTDRKERGQYRPQNSLEDRLQGAGRFGRRD